MERSTQFLEAMVNHDCSPANPESLCEALRTGTLRDIQSLIDAGVDLAGFRNEHGYDALLTVVIARITSPDTEMTAILRTLASHGARMDVQVSYGVSALSELSRECRFDAIEQLLEVGAPEQLLAWTPLCRHAALGTREDVRIRLASHPDELEVKDRWWRTPFTLAIATGRLDLAAMLLDAGADFSATDHIGRAPIFHAVMSGRTEVVRWLLDRGAIVDAVDHGGSTPLVDAVEADDLVMVDLLLAVGANPNHRQVGFPALGCVESRAMAIRLLNAGADPADLRYEQQRLFLGATTGGVRDLVDGLGPAEFERDRTRRFGKFNAEPMTAPFWHAMVRSGLTGYQAAKTFGADSFDPAGPVWCANRMGQSLTLLPDGRVVQIAGEHEDSYDPDFCIYNDVIVHHQDGRVEIFGYPSSLFPPTDFHTATQVEHRIVVIGSLGYSGERDYGTTPVFALDTRDWRIEPLSIAGEGPGWIHGHRATLQGVEIVVTGGQVLSRNGDEETSTNNSQSFSLNLVTARWC